jgi:predicted CXXCH cytochrome family protein
MMTPPRRLGSVLLGLALLPLVPGTGPGSVEVISPPAGAVLPDAPFYVIARGEPADLTVDGKPQAWGPFTGPVQAARLRLEPGRHEIRIGRHTLAVSVRGTLEPPAGTGARLHPIREGAEGCGACHQTNHRDGGTEVGAAQPGACLTCHRQVQFELKHAHPLEPLKHCNSCHAPHGSQHRGLLKAPVKKLCASCHDS